MGSDELVKRLQKEAAMLREIAKSHARGVDWQANLTASAEWFDRASAQLAEARESERAALTEVNGLKDALAQVPEFICRKCGRRQDGPTDNEARF